MTTIKFNHGDKSIYNIFYIFAYIKRVAWVYLAKYFIIQQIMIYL